MMKINILYIIDSLKYGGAEIGLLNLIRKLDKNRFRAFLACLYDGVLDDKILENDCMLFKIRKEKIRFRDPKNILTLPALVKIIIKYNIDIIHATLTVPYVWGFYAAKLCGVPIIYRVCGDETNVSFFKKINQFIPFKFTDKFVAVSEASRNQLITLGIKKKKIKIIPHGIDVDKFNPARYQKGQRNEYGFSQTDTVIGYVGRLSTEKGVKDLIAIIRKVKNKCIHTKALIVGDGPLRNEMETESKTYGLSDDIIFTGNTDNVPRILSIVDIILQPMLETVTIGWTTLEAQAMGKVVVGYHVAGSEEVIKNGINGVLVSSLDIESFADAIVAVIQNRPKLKAMEHEAKRNIHQFFNINKTIKEYERLYFQMS